MPNNFKSNNARGANASGRKPLKATVITREEAPGCVVHLRRLTVSSLSVCYRGRLVGSQVRNYPFLRLTGRWLEEAGFPIRSEVEVVVENNLLVIKPVGV